MVTHLVAVRQGGHEVGERRVVLVVRPDVVRVDEAAGGPGEVDAGDAVAGAPEQARELEPAPAAVAGAVDEDEVLVVGLVSLAAGLHLTCSFGCLQSYTTIVCVYAYALLCIYA